MSVASLLLRSYDRLATHAGVDTHPALQLLVPQSYYVEKADRSR